MGDNLSLGLQAELEPMQDLEGNYSAEVIKSTVEEQVPYMH